MCLGNLILGVALTKYLLHMLVAEGYRLLAAKCFQAFFRIQDSYVGIMYLETKKAFDIFSYCIFFLLRT